MKKVIFIALLALVTVFAFTACSGTSDGDVTDTTQSLSDLTSTTTEPDTSATDTTTLTADESRTDGSLSNDITSMRDENLSEALSGAVTDVSEDVSDMMQ